MKSFGWLLFSAALLPTVLRADLPEAAFTYQGRLGVDFSPADETKLDTPTEVRFYLYDTPEGGQPLWARSINVTPDREGRFVTVLSDAKGASLLEVSEDGPKSPSLEFLLAQTRSDERPLWLTLTVGSTGGEMLPRQPLRSLLSAYAARSAERGSDGFTVDGSLKAYTFECSGTLAVTDPVECRTLTVSGSSEAVLSGKLTALSDRLSVTGDPVKVKKTVSFAADTEADDLFPIGSIVMWSGHQTQIPDGWVLCDGSDSTVPNLGGMFLRGTVSAGAVGTTGGAAAVTLSVDEMPMHAHKVRHEIASVGYCDLMWVKRSDPGDENTWNGSSMSSSVTECDPTGGGQPHENRPPYYVLCYICRVR